MTSHDERNCAVQLVRALIGFLSMTRWRTATAPWHPASPELIMLLLIPVRH
jgi:hypothetical protein